MSRTCKLGSPHRWHSGCNEIASSGRQGIPSLNAGFRPRPLTEIPEPAAELGSWPGSPRCSACLYASTFPRERLRTSSKQLRAKVVQTDLIYDQVVWAAASSTAGHRDDLLVQDTAWQGYEQIPQWIAHGYESLFQEIDEQLHGRVADFVAVPTGVGSLLQPITGDSVLVLISTDGSV
jgi:hypothetical protein